MSSSQNGGFASNDPLAGEKFRKGLKKSTQSFGYTCSDRQPRQKPLITGHFNPPWSWLWSKAKSTRPRHRHHLPPGAKESIDVGEGRAELLEVTVERRGKALERDAELLVEGLEHGNGERPLQTGALVHTGAKHHLQQAISTWGFIGELFG